MYNLFGPFDQYTCIIILKFENKYNFAIVCANIKALACLWEQKVYSTEYRAMEFSYW